MHVFQQVLRNQRLEEALPAGAHLLLHRPELLYGPVKGHCLEDAPPPDPLPCHPPQQCHPPDAILSRPPPQAHLHLDKRGLDVCHVKATVRQLAQGVHDLHVDRGPEGLVAVRADGHALQADGEARLYPLLFHRFHAAASPDLGVLQRLQLLAQRRGLVPQQQILQHPHCQLLHERQPVLAAKHPGHHNIALLGVVRCRVHS
mmetsp:Transcript_38256/g.108152  ORF Transcript_38256/g.108152 Transcript_38256/m.108152 type:complete len:202 (+) Transcript_38256:1638-2243(+)